MQTVFIWPNNGKQHIGEAVTETARLLARFGAQALLPCESMELGLPLEGVQYVTQADGIEHCDFIVALGGDGTILRIAELAALYEKPLIGVNLGHVGFMTELEYSELRKIEKVLAGKFSIDERMMLDLTVLRGGKPLYRQTALNDVVLTKLNPFRVIQIDIRADGVPVTSFRGDGVIIATPTGSTAYSLSAGGPVLESSAENLAVTPVCAHALQAKAFVFSPEREISIAAKGPDGMSACVAADGRSGIELGAGDRVLVRRSALTTRLIRVKGRSFYHILRQKLSNGGSDS